MNLILLKRFNNYFNRIIKYYENIDGYILNHDYFITKPLNFNVNDGVSTSQVVTMPSDNNFVPDYALLVEPAGADYVILSRWFVLEWVKISGNQYKASLRNDVIANNLDAISQAPIFVEKAMLGINNPLLYNSEGMTFNQIKRKETLLKDKTGISWLVGYYNQKEEADKEFSEKFSYIGSEVPIEAGTINPNIKINYENQGQLTLGKRLSRRLSFRVLERNPGIGQINVYPSKIIEVNSSGTSFYGYHHGSKDGNAILFDFAPLGPNRQEIDTFKEWFASDTTYWNNEVPNTWIPGFNLDDTVSRSEIEELDNKLIKNGDLYYRIKVIYNKSTFKGQIEVRETEKVAKFKLSLDNYPGLAVKLDPQFNSNNDVYAKYEYDAETYNVIAEPTEVRRQGVAVTIKGSRNHLNDAPYDMFCIPYDLSGTERRKVKTADGTVYDINNELSLTIAKAIASQSGGVGSGTTLLYDLQLLPYCPIRELSDSMIENPDGSITFDLGATTGFVAEQDYTPIYEKNGESKGKTVSIMLWATKSKGTFDIEYVKEVSNDPIERKIENETESIRMCSPNYSGLFEFIPAKNNGVHKINVDYTYKPYQPYIHLNPDFDGLYGRDFNDIRGLVCGGDFSIGTNSDKFASYALQNKNYQTMFDRQIQNMDVNNKIQITSDIISSVLGAGSAAIGGGIAGSMAGVGGIGAGLLAGSASLVGGLADVALGQASFNENRQFKTDMFGYSLGNIKALPYSISKTTAFTNNNKVFPFIEEYDCTEEEKKALKDKIRYNGMTVMMVDSIGNYISNKRSFFKGQVIRLEELSDDSHVANVIYEEINKGVYL